MLTSIEKVTTETQSFILVIGNVVAWSMVLGFVKMCRLCQIRLILQLNKSALRVLQKLLRFFNCAIISTSFVALSICYFS